MTRIARSAALRLGYLPGMQTVEVPAAPATELPDPERNAVRADGGELAAVLGEGPEVTEPSHRLTDLPSGVIGDVLHGELTFEQAMAAAALRQATEEEQ
ncbi:MAG TPA: hypothetical protein VGO07_05205 [Candidatus Saccharimonadales bacterium]|nr:hypothetical protein [Candidatus Saccharimonadales bacterium]